MVQVTVERLGFDQDQAPDSHVVHGPGHGPDVFRDLRLYKNNGNMVEVKGRHHSDFQRKVRMAPRAVEVFGRNQTGSVGHWYLFFRSKGFRPAHFKELRTGDARPLRLTARDSAGTASPLAVPLAFARGHRVPHSVTP